MHSCIVKAPKPLPDPLAAFCVHVATTVVRHRLLCTSLSHNCRAWLNNSPQRCGQPDTHLLSMAASAIPT